MGTDRQEIHHGPCVCGDGEISITFCTPDHPWPTQSKWFITSISCKTCSEEYSFIEQGIHFVFVKKSDLGRREEYGREQIKRAEELLKCPEVVALLQELAVVLEGQSSMAACHRLLSLHRLDYNSVSTFRKKWSGASDWVGNNIYATNLDNVMKLLGKNDEKVAKELQELEELDVKYKEPLLIVGEPLMGRVRALHV